MTPELQQFIERTKFHLPVVRQMMEMLPADDAELDALVAETVAANDQKAFVYVTVAAAAADRRLDARHLARGAMMFPNNVWLGTVAMRMQGDIAEHLMVAIQETRLQSECEAAALLLAAKWRQEHREGVLPDKLIFLARELARRKGEDTAIMAILLALALLTQDAGLNALLRQRCPRATDVQWQDIEQSAWTAWEKLLDLYRRPVLNHVGDKPNNTLGDGLPVRRSVARLGRNEPCHCGSGKKYKHCCYDADQERLAHSSDVAGVTREELVATLDDHLTADRLDKTDPFEVVRLNPTKVPPELWDKYFLRLAAFNLFERGLEALETIGWSEKLAEGWDHVMFGAHRADRVDVARRLMQMREPHGFTEADLNICYRLFLAEDDAARCLQLIEEKARKVLQSGDTEELAGLGYAVAFSKFPALGILVYRGILPVLTPDRAAKSFEQLLIIRDRLNLSPDDPLSDLVDQRMAEQQDDAKDERKDAAALREAQDKLEAKVQEVQRYRDSVKRLEVELHRRERQAAEKAPAAPATPAVPVDEVALSTMRHKVNELKTALTERHNERNELRRELQKAYTDLEQLRAPATPAAAHEQAENDRREDDLLLPEETTGHQPVRALECPRDFPQTLRRVPPSVARGTMTALGRLAAGEPAAFHGVVRLKACPDVSRRRVGIDFRLLFRLLPDRVQVVDLIPRQDLERKIKTLL